MQEDWILRSMRKRRVGVTARLRQNVGRQATASLQFATEMAAPLELRTPAGTDGGSPPTECGWKHGDNGAGDNGQNAVRERCAAAAGEKARWGAHEALPHTPPGGKPPETPAPFPSGSIIQNGGHRSRVRKPRKTGAPLTDGLRSEAGP